MAFAFLQLAQSEPSAADVVGVLLIGAAVVVAAIALAVALILTFIVHLTLAIVIWTRTPPTYIGMHKTWWGVLTLLFGLFAAVPFFILHYRRGAPTRCYRCGFDAASAIRGSNCPECGMPRLGVPRPRYATS